MCRVGILSPGPLHPRLSLCSWSGNLRASVSLLLRRSWPFCVDFAVSPFHRKVPALKKTGFAPGWRGREEAGGVGKVGRRSSVLPPGERLGPVRSSLCPHACLLRLLKCLYIFGSRICFPNCFVLCSVFCLSICVYAFWVLGIRRSPSLCGFQEANSGLGKHLYPVSRLTSSYFEIKTGSHYATLVSLKLTM